MLLPPARSMRVVLTCIVCAAAFYFIPAQAMTKNPYPQHPPDRDLNSVKLVAGF